MDAGSQEPQSSRESSWEGSGGVALLSKEYEYSIPSGDTTVVLRQDDFDAPMKELYDNVRPSLVPPIQTSWLSEVERTVEREEQAHEYSEAYANSVYSSNSYAEEMCGSDDVESMDESEKMFWRQKNPDWDYQQIIVRCLILERRRRLLEVLRIEPSEDAIYGGRTLRYAKWLRTRFEDWEPDNARWAVIVAKNFGQLKKETETSGTEQSPRDLLQHHLQLDMGIASDREWRQSKEFQLYLGAIMWGGVRYEEVENGAKVYLMIPGPSA